MMEFTHEGAVRYGFGFYNPNHAAALIVMLIPTLWMMRSLLTRNLLKILVLVPELVLYAGLALTLSRAGFLALIVCATTWGFMSHAVTKNETASGPRKIKRHSCLPGALRITVPVCIISLVALACGALPRFLSWITNPDQSFLNRFKVWAGASRLLADNPFGVGKGLSGKIYTSFYNQVPHASYRTMVNSFLTVIVEYGVLWGFLLLAILMFAAFGLLAIWRRSRTDGSIIVGQVAACLFVSLLAGIIAGMGSTCFDLEILFNSGKPIYSPSNDRLQDVLLLCFASMIFVCLSVCIKTRWRSMRKLVIVSCTSSLMLLVSIMILGTVLDYVQNGPQIKVERQMDNSTWAIVQGNKSEGSVLMVLPQHGDIQEIMRLREEYYPAFTYSVPLSPPSQIRDIIKNTPDNWKILLCGTNSRYLEYCGNKQGILYKPESFASLELCPKIDSVYLSSWDEKGNNGMWEQPLKPLNIPIVYLESY